jgi:hypothetical protein
MRAAYLDSSAVVKLVIAEPEGRMTLVAPKEDAALRRQAPGRPSSTPTFMHVDQLWWFMGGHGRD